MRFTGDNEGTPPPGETQGGSNSLAFTIQLSDDVWIDTSVRYHGLRPFGEILKGVMEKLAPDQDNVPSLSARQAFTEQAIANRRRGGVMSSALRKLGVKGDARREATRKLADDYSISLSEAENLIAFHHRRRSNRINRARSVLLPMWRHQKLSVRQIASRLNVSSAQAHRLITQYAPETEGN